MFEGDECTEDVFVGIEFTEDMMDVIEYGVLSDSGVVIAT